MEEELPKYVVFDIDGVVLPDPSQSIRLITKFLRSEGLVSSSSLLGKRFLESLFLLTDGLGVFRPDVFKNARGPTRQYISEKVNKFFAKSLKNAQTDYVNQIMDRVVEEADIVEGLQGFIEEAKKRGYTPVFCSALPKFFVEALGRKLGVHEDHCLGSEYGVNGKGVYNGKIKPGGLVTLAKKGEILDELGGRVHMVFGDSMRDFEMFRRAEIGIGVHPRNELPSHLSELAEQGKKILVAPSLSTEHFRSAAHFL